MSSFKKYSKKVIEIFSLIFLILSPLIYLSLHIFYINEHDLQETRKDIIKKSSNDTEKVKSIIKWERKEFIKKIRYN